jgi:hypothetical protein
VVPLISLLKVGPTGKLLDEPDSADELLSLTAEEVLETEGPTGMLWLEDKDTMLELPWLEKVGPTGTDDGEAEPECE